MKHVEMKWLNVDKCSKEDLYMYANKAYQKKYPDSDIKEQLDYLNIINEYTYTELLFELASKYANRYALFTENEEYEEIISKGIEEFEY